MTPRRVLILTDYGGSRGGAERLALDLRRRLGDRGIDTRLLTSSADSWDRADAPDVVTFGTTGPHRALVEAFNPLAALRLSRTIRDFAPDVVHILMFLTQLSPSILLALRSVPTVYTACTYRLVCPTGLRWRAGEGLCERTVGTACVRSGCFDTLGWQPRGVQMKLLRSLGSALDALVCTSTPMAGIFAAHGYPDARVIPNGVDETRFPARPGDMPTAAFAGRLVPEKGVDWLLRSFAACRRRAQSRLLIIGDGPERANLEGLARTLGLGDSCHFTGSLRATECQSRLAQAWVQVVPSLWAEPFGLVTAEAMMRGTAVIASREGGALDMVVSGRTGLLVDTNDIQELADAMDELLGNRVTCERHGREGRQRALEHWHADGMIDTYLTLYSALISAADISRAET